jgi:hypothetical protein
VAVAASTVRHPFRGGWTPKSRSVEGSGTGSRSGRAVTVKSMEPTSGNVKSPERRKLWRDVLGVPGSGADIHVQIPEGPGRAGARSLRGPVAGGLRALLRLRIARQDQLSLHLPDGEARAVEHELLHAPADEFVEYLNHRGARIAEFVGPVGCRDPADPIVGQPSIDDPTTDLLAESRIAHRWGSCGVKGWA